MTDPPQRRKSKRTPPREVSRLTIDDTRALVFADNAEAQQWFAKVFAGDVRAAVAAITKAFNRYKDLADLIALEERPANVMLFVHTAINSVLSSMHLFVSGYPVPAGQLMRHFAECVAMAMMCSDESCGVFQAYAADRRSYPVHKSLHLVTQDKISKSLQKSLNMDKEGYARFARVMKFYDHHSHASALTLSYSMMFTEAGGLVIGSQIDPTKKDQYRKELKMYKQASETLTALVSVLDAVLPRRNQGSIARGG